MITTITAAQFMQAMDDLLISTTVPERLDIRNKYGLDSFFYFHGRLRLAVEIALSKFFGAIVH